MTATHQPATPSTPEDAMSTTTCPIGLGTRTGYMKGCRCDDCRAANAAYSAEHRARHGLQVQPIGPRLTPVEPTPWMAHKACTADQADLFFPARGEMDKVEQAKAICATCPVKAECLDYAVRNHEHHGIWGGTSGRDRREARRRQNRRRAA